MSRENESSIKRRKKIKSNETKLREITINLYLKTVYPNRDSTTNETVE